MQEMSKSESLKATLESLRIWFAENPNLPEEIDAILLKRFLKCMQGDVEAAKKLIELNYAMRNKHAHIFIKRDPFDELTKKTRATAELVILPGLTPERHQVLLFRLIDCDPSKLNSVEESKIFFMISDCRFTMPDSHAEVENEESLDNLADGDVQICDISGYTMSHIARISFMTLRIYMKFLQEAFPTRLRALHIINCPTFLDKMIAIVKPFINDEVYKMIHFHTNGLDSLYEKVPRDMLPDEYGGKAGKMADLKQKWTQVLEDKREYLMDAKQWNVEKQPTRSRWSWW